MSGGRWMQDGASVPDALLVALVARVPVLVWGDPGIGKTSVVVQLAARCGWRCEVVVGSVREASDFVGLPVRSDGGVVFQPPAWARRLAESGGVLFLDELTTAAPAVQAAMLRVVLDRQVGDLRLPEGVAVVAAANPPEVAADGWELSAPLANRFCHLSMTVNAAAWAAGMRDGFRRSASCLTVAEPSPLQREHWRTQVADFIEFRPELLHRMPSESAGRARAWPSPRSWEMVGVLAATAEACGASSGALRALIAGCVGDGPAIEFLAWVADYGLPDPEWLLGHADGLPVGMRPDLLLVLLDAVVARVKAHPTRRRWEQAWEVLATAAAHGTSDVATLIAGRLLPLRRRTWSLPASATMFTELLSADRDG